MLSHIKQRLVTHYMVTTMYNAFYALCKYYRRLLPILEYSSYVCYTSKLLAILYNAPALPIVVGTFPQWLVYSLQISAKLHSFLL